MPGRYARPILRRSKLTIEDIIDALRILEVCHSVDVGSEAAALQRRFYQFRQMLDSLTEANDDHQMFSVENSIFKSVMDVTIPGASNAQENEVFQSFPVHWTNGMNNIYSAMKSRDGCGNTASLIELSSWTGQSFEQAQYCLHRLYAEARVIPCEAKGTWKLVEESQR